MSTAVKTMSTHQPKTETTDSGWNSLYVMAAIAALLTVIFIPIAIVVFISWPPPATVIDWFNLFQNNKLVALIDFDLLIVLSNVISIPITLALYVALRRVSL